LREVGGVRPGRALLALVLIVLGTLTEGIGLLVLVPLLQLAGVDLQHGVVGSAAHHVRATFRLLGLPLHLLSVLVLFVGLVVLHATVHRWHTVTTSALQVEFTAHLRKRVHRAVTGADWPHLARHRGSELAHTLTAQVDRLGTGIAVVQRLALDGMLVAVYLAATLYVSPPVTAIVVAAALTLALLVRPSTRAATRVGLAITNLWSDTYRAVLEHLASIKLAKSYGAEERSTGLFARVADRVAEANLRAATIQSAARFRFEVGAAVLAGGTLYAAIRWLAVPPVELLVLLLAFARIMPRLSALEQGGQRVRHLLADFSAVMALERTLARHQPAPTTPGAPLPPLRQAIRLEAVTYRYDAEPDGAPEETALVGVTLAIPAARVTAITGPSGAGKSTLADVLLGLLVPQHGRVLVDDAVLTVQRLPAWRDRIGYVPQEPFLFHDTVRANLQWARPEASEDELRQALAAAAADFAERLPRGLDTVVGDRGVRLSGGERQRVALARALLRQPAVLILDEATSSLDAESERRVQEALDRLRGRLTVVVITHRLPAVRRADLIHVLEAGRLVESGDWDTLRAASGRFRALCRAQGLDG
jgi:ATP-binding cassette subfamily C protein